MKRKRKKKKEKKGRKNKREIKEKQLRNYPFFYLIEYLDPSCCEKWVVWSYERFEEDQENQVTKSTSIKFN